MAGKKIAGMKPKVAIGVALVSFVLVYLWYRNRSQNAAIPTQTQTTPQVGPDPNATAGAAPAPVTDTTGGVQQSLGDTLSTLSSFLGSLPYTSYNYAPTITGSYNTTSTTYYGASGGGPPSEPGPTPGPTPGPFVPPVQGKVNVASYAVPLPTLAKHNAKGIGGKI